MMHYQKNIKFCLKRYSYLALVDLTKYRTVEA